MAEQPPGYEFVAVDAADIIKDRQNEWQRFTRFTTFAVVAVVVLLLGLFLFVA